MSPDPRLAPHRIIQSGNKKPRPLRRIRRDYAQFPHIFVTERAGPMTDANVRKIQARAGRLACLPFPVHPHMLRHACGYKLANDGHDTRAIQHYLGHRNIVHTVRYTELAADRFRGSGATKRQARKECTTTRLVIQLVKNYHVSARFGAIPLGRRWELG